MTTYDIICTFQKKEQINLIINFNEIPANLIESQFIIKIFKQLSFNEIKTLNKLSCCQLNTDKDEDLPFFILMRNGKYYFDSYKNIDEDTYFWDNFRIEYLRKYNCIYTCMFNFC